MNAIRFAVAVLVAASGIVSLLVFVARIRRRDYGLLYFGLGASMYGARLFLQVAEHAGGLADVALTMLLPAPLMLFMVEAVAREWKRVAWWIVGVELMAAALAIGARLLEPKSVVSWRINTFVVFFSIPVWVSMAFLPRRPPSRDMRILRSGLIVFLSFVIYTNLFWLGWLPGGGYLEFIGFSVLLGCLGHVAFARTQRNEERLLTLNKELEIAKDMQARLLPEPTSEMAGLTIATRYVPATAVAGDFYDFLIQDDSLGVLIADVSGHGIPAALSASMVKVAVRAQMARAGDPAAVLLGMNSILCGNLQGQFVSAGYLFLNPGQGVLHYAGAGHPPVLIWRSRQRLVESLEENGLLLGILPNASYTQKTAHLERGDRCVLYTDGLLEATCPSGEEFGEGRLRNVLVESASLTLNAFCDALMQKLAEWCGATSRQQDDVTIVAIDFA